MNTNVTNTETKIQDRYTGDIDEKISEWEKKLAEKIGKEQLETIMNMASKDMSFNDMLKFIDIIAESLTVEDVEEAIEILDAGDADEEIKLFMVLLSDRIKLKENDISDIDISSKFSFMDKRKPAFISLSELKSSIKDIFDDELQENQASESSNESVTPEKLKKLVERSTVLIKKGKNCSKREIEQFLRDVDEVMKCDKNDMLAILAKSVGSIHPDVVKKLESEKKKAEIEAESKKAFSYGEVLQQAGVQTV